MNYMCSKINYIRKIYELNYGWRAKFYTSLLFLFGIICALYLIYYAYNESSKISLYNAMLPENNDFNGNDYQNVSQMPSNCSLWDCFNMYRCGKNGANRISIYVYPLEEYIVSRSQKSSIISKEFYQIIETVVHSIYYTPFPDKACLFMPSIDLRNSLFMNKEKNSLKFWNNGENHIIFNMLSNSKKLNAANNGPINMAMILGGFIDKTYRPGFDLALPVWSPSLENHAIHISFKSKRIYLLIAVQLNSYQDNGITLHELTNNNSNDVLYLESCIKNTQSSNNLNVQCYFNNSQMYEYPKILSKGTFCLVLKSWRVDQTDFLEMLVNNCIPVVYSLKTILPFHDVIDWSLATIRVREQDLPNIVDILKSISQIKIKELQEQGRGLFKKYFRNIRTITMTALDILNERVFPHKAKTIQEWNTIDFHKRNNNPLFLPIIAKKAQGFTAVILTYDRVKSLFTLINKLSLVSSLQSIVVIWNNQLKTAPNLTTFPKITKTLKVIQTHSNKLSHRFFPYDEIETEAILTIDDDIVMLTADELNFGFEVWREFPDRIVGFPSRVHMWDNKTMSWRYESEWTNHISMVLTGAAFHHKYWSYMYTNFMPGGIKDWVDDLMNCEDIAMNFLISNITRKAPIKVAPRKKFKCPECTKTEMLSADLNHMLERSACIDRFSQIYGHMPLKSVEFRADPVLYKDNFPEKLKWFNDIGSL